MEYSVYRITFSWGAYYIGFTGGPLTERLEQHRTSGSPAMQRAFERETRLGYPTIVALSTHGTEDAARAEEKRLIDAAKFDTLCLND